MSWSNAVSAAQLGGEAALAYYQYKRAQELRKKGIKNITPASLKVAKAQADALANNTQIAGYDKALGLLDSGVSTAIGETKKGASSSQDVLNQLVKINANRNRSVNSLAIEGAAANERRRADARDLAMKTAAFEEQSRQERDAAIGAMEGAAIQNANNVLTGTVGVLTANEDRKRQGSVPDYGDVETMETMGADYTTPTRTMRRVPTTSPDNLNPDPNDPTTMDFDQYMNYRKKQIPRVY